MLLKAQGDGTSNVSTFLKIRKDTVVWLAVQVKDMPIGLQLVQGQQIFLFFKLNLLGHIG